MLRFLFESSESRIVPSASHQHPTANDWPLPDGRDSEAGRLPDRGALSFLLAANGSYPPVTKIDRNMNHQGYNTHLWPNRR